MQVILFCYLKWYQNNIFINNEDQGFHSAIQIRNGLKGVVT